MTLPWLPSFQQTFLLGACAGGARLRRYTRRQFLIRSKCASNLPSGPPNLEYETGEVRDRDRSGAKFRQRAETGKV